MQVPMTPIRILKRAVKLYSEKTAVVDGGIRLTYRQVAKRVNQVTNAIYNLGIPPGGRLAMLDYNSHRYMEMYFGAAQSGRVLLPLNTQLSADEYVYILDDAEAEAVVFHADFKPVMDQVRTRTRTVKYFFIAEGEADTSWMAGTYENLLAAQSADAIITEPDDENDMLNLYYTSGTTGRPKGVIADPPECLRQRAFHDYLVQIRGFHCLASHRPAVSSGRCVFHLVGHLSGGRHHEPAVQAQGRASENAG